MTSVDSGPCNASGRTDGEGKEATVALEAFRSPFFYCRYFVSLLPSGRLQADGIDYLEKAKRWAFWVLGGEGGSII